MQMRFIIFNKPNNVPKLQVYTNIYVNVSVSWRARLGLGRLETCFLNVSVSSRGMGVSVSSCNVLFTSLQLILK